MTRLACPRCLGGRMVAEADGDRTCLQCGYRPVPPDPLPLVQSSRADQGDRAGRLSTGKGPYERQRSLALKHGGEA